MNINGQVFVRLRGKISLKSKEAIYLKDLAEISAERKIKEKLENLTYPINIKEQGNILISSISIISFIKQNISDIDLVVIGETDILVDVQQDKVDTDKYKIVRVILVCFLLFIGSITAIMNFHSDVDMKQAHKVIYRVITGVETDRLLLLQIPYSLGIGVGMSIFFNHIFNKKINKEPTPLEMEVYSYQQGIDEYMKNNNTRRQ